MLSLRLLSTNITDIDHTFNVERLLIIHYVYGRASIPIRLHQINGFK